MKINLFLYVFIPIFSFNVHSLDFNQYCRYQLAEQDCSVEFSNALLDAANTNEELLFFQMKNIVLNELILLVLH
jgi:hypothetical protein